MRILVVAAAEVPSVANNKAAILGLNAWKGAEAWHCSVRLVDISATKTTSGRALTNARVRTHTHTHTHTHAHTCLQVFELWIVLEEAVRERAQPIATQGQGREAF